MDLFIDILKEVSIILILAVPPWVIFRKYLKQKVNQIVLFLLFIIYILATLFTQNLLPFLLVFIILIKENKKKDSRFSSLTRPLGRYKFEVILYSLSFRFIITIITIVIGIVIQSYGYKLEAQQITNMFLEAGTLKLIWLSLIAVIFAPVLEEYVFRHIIYRGLCKKVSKPMAAILSSALFMLLHFNLISSLATFALGLINCRFYDKYGYRASVMNHFIFNFLSTAIMIYVKVANVNLGV